MKRFAMLAMVMALFAGGLLAQEWPIYGDAKERISATPATIWSQVDSDGAIVSLHENGLVSMATIAEDGSLVMSFATNGAVDIPQGQVGDEPVPVLRTSWCDAKGVTHEVVTPIVSTTDAGLDRATALHDKLVSRQQAKHPPRPCPPAGP